MSKVNVKQVAVFCQHYLVWLLKKKKNANYIIVMSVANSQNIRGNAIPSAGHHKPFNSLSEKLFCGIVGSYPSSKWFTAKCCSSPSSSLKCIRAGSIKMYLMYIGSCCSIFYYFNHTHVFAHANSPIRRQFKIKTFRLP